MDRFGRSLRFGHQEFDKETLFVGQWSENGQYLWGVLNFMWF